MKSLALLGRIRVHDCVEDFFLCFLMYRRDHLLAQGFASLPATCDRAYVKRGAATPSISDIRPLHIDTGYSPPIAENRKEKHQIK